jgi:hypothetical protein
MHFKFECMASCIKSHNLMAYFIELAEIGPEEQTLAKAQLYIQHSAIWQSKCGQQLPATLHH